MRHSKNFLKQGKFLPCKEDNLSGAFAIDRAERNYKMNEQKRRTKKKKYILKPRAMDIVCLVGGVVIGEVIAMLTQNIGFLRWLSYDVAFGFRQPLELSFVLFKVAFGFSIHLNPAVVLFALLGLITGRYLRASAKKEQSVSVEREDDEQ